MLIKKIKFTDYNGKEREEEFAFNLNKAEVIQWMMTTGDYTLDKVLIKLSKERNGKEIMKTFEDFIRRSYGEISMDGREFVKTDAVKDRFMNTEAYSILFCELVTDAKKASEFVNAVIPSDLAKEVQDIMDKHPDGIPDDMKDYVKEVQPITSVTSTSKA